VRVDTEHATAGEQHAPGDLVDDPVCAGSGLVDGDRTLVVDTALQRVVAVDRQRIDRTSCRSAGASATPVRTRQIGRVSQHVSPGSGQLDR
jgi:hypothetical protein